MVITPKSEIIFLHVPIEIDNKNQLTFANANAQFQYFRFLPEQKVYDDCTYQRKDGYIRMNANFDELISFNYVMYQNENHSGKWYYAFITRIEYINDNMSKVFIKTDVWQTYQFDLTFKQSFVEREMCNISDDIPGFNLIVENLETGEFIEDASTSIKGMGICYVIAYSRDPAEDNLGASASLYNGAIINGIASGLWYYVANMTKILEMIKTISDKGFGDSIISVFSIPTTAIFPYDDYTIDELDDPYQVWGFWITNQYESTGRTVTLNGVPSKLDGYTPRNKKLLTYPYCYLGFTPTNGNQAIFRYENFKNNPSFRVISEINPNPNVYFLPQNYKNVSGVNVSEGVSANGYPSISYHTDYFNGWLAQNSNLINLDLAQNQFNFELNALNTTLDGTGNSINQLTKGNIGSALTGIGETALDVYGQGVNYDFYVKNQMAQIEKQQMLPNKGSMGASATLIGYGYQNDDIFTRYTIKNQFARRIDKYFDMYGYATNELKLPNINNRPNWNYIKTLGLNIIAQIPQEDLQEIKNLFDNGITLWHNPATFLDYSQNNR